jgi:hypothetical protein
MSRCTYPRHWHFGWLGHGSFVGGVSSDVYVRVSCALILALELSEPAA